MSDPASRSRALPRGIRNHNPGNIRRSRDPWQGLAAQQTDPEFLQFESAKWGIRALARTLITYQDRLGLSTVARMIGRWAPPTENATDVYVRAVARHMGVDPNARISVHEYATLQPMVEAIIQQENSQQPYTDAEIDAALVLAGVEPPQRALSQTRTVRGGQVAAAGGVLSIATGASEAFRDYVPLAQTLAQAAPWLVAGLVLAGVAWIIWARIDDRRRGLR
jgi:hypothetical protein